MCFFGSFIPATFFITLAYSVWFATAFAEGRRRKWGKCLAVWLLVMALGFIAGGTVMTIAGTCPVEQFFSQTSR